MSNLRKLFNRQDCQFLQAMHIAPEAPPSREAILREEYRNLVIENALLRLDLEEAERQRKLASRAERADHVLRLIVVGLVCVVAILALIAAGVLDA